MDDLSVRAMKARYVRAVRIVHAHRERGAWPCSVREVLECAREELVRVCIATGKRARVHGAKEERVKDERACRQEWRCRVCTRYVRASVAFVRA